MQCHTPLGTHPSPDLELSYFFTGVLAERGARSLSLSRQCRAPPISIAIEVNGQRTSALRATDADQRLWPLEKLAWRLHLAQEKHCNQSFARQAEIAISLFSRQCLGKRRIAGLPALTTHAEQWTRRANRHPVKINWQFTRKAARERFAYRMNRLRRSENLQDILTQRHSPRAPLPLAHESAKVTAAAPDKPPAPDAPARGGPPPRLQRRFSDTAALPGVSRCGQGPQASSSRVQERVLGPG